MGGFYSSAESDEWYTPRKYLDLVEKVIGRIDLDPCSCPEAQLTIEARFYFDNLVNGQSVNWRVPEGSACLSRLQRIQTILFSRPAKSVFCNPPFSLISDFSKRMIDEYSIGNFEEGILLCNASVDAKWFKPLWDFEVCLTDHRIRFDAPEGYAYKLTPDKLGCVLNKRMKGIPRTANTKGQAFVYFGNNHVQFRDVFKSIGEIIPARKRRFYRG